MIQQRTTNSQHLFSKLALGTVQFGLEYGISNQSGKTSLREVGHIFETANAYGINMLDTAQAYGDSEDVIGKLNKNRFEVITKLHPNELNKQDARDMVTSSMERLGSLSLYGVLFHDAQSALTHPEAVEALKSKKLDERIKKYGYSVYTPEELEQLLAAYGVPDLMQVPFSHLDRRFEHHLKTLKQKGVEIHTRSTFLQGLFFMNVNELSDFFNPVKEYIGRLQSSFKNMSELAAYLLKFAVEQPFIDKIVVGVNDARQLNENLCALSRVEETIDLEVPSVNSKILMPNLWPKN